MAKLSGTQQEAPAGAETTSAAAHVDNTAATVDAFSQLISSLASATPAPTRSVQTSSSAAPAMPAGLGALLSSLTQPPQSAPSAAPGLPGGLGALLSGLASNTTSTTSAPGPQASAQAGAPKLPGTAARPQSSKARKPALGGAAGLGLGKGLVPADKATQSEASKKESDVEVDEQHAEAVMVEA